MRYFLPLLLLLGCEQKDPRHPSTAASEDFLFKYEKILDEMPKQQYITYTIANGDTIKQFGANIMNQELHTQDEALDFARDRIDHFITLANSDKKMTEILDPYPLKRERVVFTISFWDENMDRPAKPYVAKLTFDGKLATLHYKREDSEALDETSVSIPLFKQSGS